MKNKEPMNWENEFDKKWDNYKFSINNDDHYDGQDKEKLKYFISKIAQEEYDRGAMEATNVCNDKVIPEAIKAERERIIKEIENQDWIYECIGETYLKRILALFNEN